MAHFSAVVLMLVLLTGCATSRPTSETVADCRTAVEGGAGIMAFGGRIAGTVALLGSWWTPLQLAVEGGAMLIESAGELMAEACAPVVLNRTDAPNPIGPRNGLGE